MREDKINFMIGLGGVVVGLIGIGYGMGSRKKLTDICAKLDKTIDELSNDIEVDLSDMMVGVAVEKAVDREAKNVVSKAIKEIKYDVECDMRKEIKSAVITHSSEIKQSVSKEIEKQVSRIRIDDMKDEVVERAKLEVADRLDKNLDGILEKFNGDLTNISKIYQSIANVMGK